ncbi:MAG TPA: glycosyltransferase family protein [Chitinophagaceae bacterium]
MIKRKVTAIVQARTGATRLPNKVFLPLAGRPLIWHVFDRLRYSKQIDEYVLATTTSKGDDALEQWARENNIPCFRGSEADVLARYYGAARSHQAEVIVRITADDPFKDPLVIDQVIGMFIQQGLDFAYNNKPPSFPEGLDTEVFSFEALKLAQEKSNDPFEREHVTQYFYRNPDDFKQSNLAYEKDLSYLRWTLDTAEDYAMVKLVYEKLYKEGAIFLMNDILALLEREPGIAEMNSGVKRSAMYGGDAGI